MSHINCFHNVSISSIVPRDILDFTNFYMFTGYVFLLQEKYNATAASLSCADTSSKTLFEQVKFKIVSCVKYLYHVIRDSIRKRWKRRVPVDRPVICLRHCNLKMRI